MKITYEQARQDLIPNLRVEYFGVIEALRRQDEQQGTNLAQHVRSFYDFLVTKGLSRYQLSALGISRDNALGWKG